MPTLPPLPNLFYEVHEARINAGLSQHGNNNFAIALRENYDPNHMRYANLQVWHDREGSMTIQPASQSDYMVILEWYKRNANVPLEDFE